MFYYDLLKKELFDYINSEYSKKNIMDKMNSFFGFSVVEKLRFISFDDEQKINVKIDSHQENVTNNKYKIKINSVKNEKIKSSLLELTKVFRKK